jgi:hypothetical protein
MLRTTLSLLAGTLFAAGCASPPPYYPPVPVSHPIDPIRVPHAPERQTAEPLNAMLFDKVFGPCVATQLERLNSSRTEGVVVSFPQRMSGTINCGVTDTQVTSALKALGSTPAMTMQANGVPVATNFVPAKVGAHTPITRQYIDNDRLLRCEANVLFVPAGTPGPSLPAGTTVLPKTHWSPALTVPANMALPLMGAQVLTSTGNPAAPYKLTHQSSTLVCGTLGQSRIGTTVPQWSPQQ